MPTHPEYHAWRKAFIKAHGRPPTAYEAWVASRAATQAAPAAASTKESA